MRKILVLSLALILLLGIMSHGTSGFFSDTEDGVTTLCAWTTECESPCGNNYIALVNQTWDGTNSTWTYEITSGTAPALSHWVLEWCDCSAVVAVYENGVLIPPGEWECGHDPHTGLWGIKFDNGYDDGETRTITLVLDDDYVQGQITVGTKAAHDIDIGTICGPVCDECTGHSDPVVNVTFPDHYVVYYIGDTIPISWCVTDADGDLPLTVNIDFSADDGLHYGYHIATIQQNSLGCNSYSWKIPWVQYLISDDCRIKVTATDSCGSGFGVSARFCPHLPPPPEVTVISPNGGESWQAGQTYPIIWATQGDFPEMMLIDVYFSSNNGDSWIKILSDEENDGVCLWPVPAGMPTSNEARVRIMAKYPIELSGQDDSDQAFTLLELGSPPPEPGPGQAYNLVVDKNAVTQTFEGETICDLDLANSSGEDGITIDRLIISWEPNSGDSRLVEIWSAGELAYATMLTSGSERDIFDFTLSAGEEDNISFIFSDGKFGETISLEFIMSDGSIVMVSFQVVTD